MKFRDNINLVQLHVRFIGVIEGPLDRSVRTNSVTIAAAGGALPAVE